MSKPPSKYEPLSQRLSAHQGDEWRANFSDLEQVLGFALPKGARTGRTWWANDPEKGHSRSWAGQGWEVGDIDPTTETVLFRRSAASPATIQKVANLEPLAEGVNVEAPEVAPQPSPPAAELMGQAEEAAPQPASQPAGEIEPLKEMAGDPPKPQINKAVGMGALVAGGVAIVAGLGALAVRGLVRRR